MKRDALQRLVHFLLRTITRTEYLNADCLPAEGPVIIATNHLSLVDTPVLFDNPRRPDITALVTTKYMKYPFVKWFINSGEGIWIDRDTADFGAFRKAIEALKRGWCVTLGGAARGPRNAHWSRWTPDCGRGRARRRRSAPARPGPPAEPGRVVALPGR